MHSCRQNKKITHRYSLDTETRATATALHPKVTILCQGVMHPTAAQKHEQSNARGVVGTKGTMNSGSYRYKRYTCDSRSIAMYLLLTYTTLYKKPAV